MYNLCKKEREKKQSKNDRQFTSSLLQMLMSNLTICRIIKRTTNENNNYKNMSYTKVLFAVNDYENYR